jgi:hypothetical protein
MTAPDPRGPSSGPTPGAAEQNPYAAAEKLMAQWEARHAVAASGRRVVGQGVSEYLSHERCTEACSSTGHKRHHGEDEDRAKARKQHRPPPDVHPHFSDLLAWVLPVSSEDDGTGRGRDRRR